MCNLCSTQLLELADNSSQNGLATLILEFIHANKNLLVALLLCKLQKVLLPKYTVGAALPEQFQFLHQFFRPHFVLRLQGQHADCHTV